MAPNLVADTVRTSSPGPVVVSPSSALRDRILQVQQRSAFIKTHIAAGQQRFDEAKANIAQLKDQLSSVRKSTERIHMKMKELAQKMGLSIKVKEVICDDELAFKPPNDEEKQKIKDACKLPRHYWKTQSCLEQDLRIKAKLIWMKYAFRNAQVFQGQKLLLTARFDLQIAENAFEDLQYQHTLKIMTGTQINKALGKERNLVISPIPDIPVRKSLLKSSTQRESNPLHSTKKAPLPPIVTSPELSSQISEEYLIPPSPRPTIQRYSTLPEIQRSSPMPGIQRSSPLPGIQRSSPLPGIQRSSPLPGIQRSSPLPGIKKSCPLPGIQKSSPLPGIQRFSPLPQIQTSAVCTAPIAQPTSWKEFKSQLPRLQQAPQRPSRSTSQQPSQLPTANRRVPEQTFSRSKLPTRSK